MKTSLIDESQPKNQSKKEQTKPFIVELGDDEGKADPAAAEEISDIGVKNAAMERILAQSARQTPGITKWFWRIFFALFSFVISLSAFDYLTGLMARNQILGAVATGLMVVLVIILVIVAMKEFSFFMRLRAVDQLQDEAERALTSRDLVAAKVFNEKICRFYHKRDDLSWGIARYKEREAEVLDADALLSLAQKEVIAPLDRQALDVVENTSKQVALATALVPLALVDVIAALTLNLRMIRQIAHVYGGRSGVLGSIKLSKAVFAHLVATGAVSLADDLVTSFAGGGVLSKLSRRFGEGVVNGALSARVGVAAMQVCRPIVFDPETRPSVSKLMKRSMVGIFGKES